VDGKPYRAVLAVYLIAVERWEIIDGEAALQGVNLLDLTIRRFYNAIYAWAIQRVKDPEEFDQRLAALDSGPRIVTEQTVQGEMDAFAGLMAATN
jgi:hypothetical protein